MVVYRYLHDLSNTASHLCPASLTLDTLVQSRLSGLLSVLPIHHGGTYPWLCIGCILCLESLLPPMSTGLSLKSWHKCYFLRESFPGNTFCNFNHCSPHTLLICCPCLFPLHSSNYQLLISCVFNKLYKGRNYHLSCSLVYPST